MIGGIGLPELIVILVIALLVVGPKRLPDVGRSIGEAVRGFRRAIKDADKLAVEESEKSRHDGRAGRSD
ncbi:MAG: twin-arginine translocase TatA/TatE family subunit [Deltaproteobacteria bacterium]|nr:twin-arginine translocase TatA/TatE family subunit [Deltaproteobacteria bacterium]